MGDLEQMFIISDFCFFHDQFELHVLWKESRDTKGVLTKKMEKQSTPIGLRKTMRLEKKSLNKPFKSPLTGAVSKANRTPKAIDVEEEIRLYQLGLKQLEDKQRILDLTSKWRSVAKNALETLRNLVAVENGASITLAEMALMVKVQIQEIGKYDPDQDEFIDKAGATALNEVAADVKPTPEGKFDKKISSESIAADHALAILPSGQSQSLGSETNQVLPSSIPLASSTA